MTTATEELLQYRGHEIIRKDLAAWHYTPQEVWAGVMTTAT
jgi:hypothetical protein